jgi:DNA-binding response OmpR family regulator
VARRSIILLVEDDVDLRRLYRLTLTFEGFDVREAGDGFEALRQVDEQPPDLIVLDIDLPLLSGLTVQQEVAARALTRRLPVVIVTGSEMELGQVDVPCLLRKPVTPERLVQTVRSCLVDAAGSARL